jgi:hypothetical protein
MNPTAPPIPSDPPPPADLVTAAAEIIARLNATPRSKDKAA